MSLKLAFEAFRVFIRTERLSVRAGTFLVHMAWVFFVAMLLWCGGFFSQACAAQPPQAALQYRDDVIRNARLEWGLSAPVADFAAQLHQESGWRPDAISPAGAQGLAQFMPATADWISQLIPMLSSREPFNPAWAIRAGRQGGSVHRITFREAVSEGLFRRVCLRTGKEWSEASEQAWMASVYKFYGAGASEELDCIPANGGGAWLSRALIESRMSADTPVLRLTCKEGYELLSDEVRFRETQDWLDEHLKPLLEALPAGARSFLGRDFGRSGDLSVDYPLLQEKNLIRRVPFVLELRNVPFRQQEQITWYLMDGLPGLLGAAFDARGNGAYLAEYAMQRYGSGRVQQVMPTEGWYREHMPPVKAALEDGNLVDLPKDEDTLDDLRAVQVVNGVPRVPEQRSKAKADGGKRHGDSAIALALAYFASREINKGPVKASSRRRRQAARMLEGY